MMEKQTAAQNNTGFVLMEFLIYLFLFGLIFAGLFGGIFAAMKGAKASDELQSAKRAIALLGGSALPAKEFFIENCGERTILCVKKISQTPPKYPRASAQIAKKPLE